ncbi:MAG TPA: hypothetical protein VJS92_03505, partial [Candidatus Polarisedimenticolaceae bacterium]|nr:hypothetical protein [Candidatus Polarisedimenticolaceae bacterium]
MEVLSSRAIEWGVATNAHPGQSVLGDAHAVCAFPGGYLLGVVDGLGHGSDAARSARICVETLEGHAAEPVLALMGRCHLALRGTRGATLSLASFRFPVDEMTWTGAGDVAAVLVRAGAAPAIETLVQPG